MNVTEWLEKTGRRPLPLPGAFYAWFKEGETTCLQSSLPVRLFKCLAGFKTKNCIYGSYPLESLKAAWKKSTSKWFFPFKPNLRDPQEPDYCGSFFHFVYEDKYDNGYATSTKVYYTEPLHMKLAVEKNPAFPSYFIRAKLGDWYIPFFDADTAEDYNFIRIYLGNSQLPYACMESSPGHYWFFLDCASTDYVTVMEPFCTMQMDMAWYKISNERKMSYIRAERRETKPQLLINTLQSQVMRRFVTKLIQHFEHPWTTEIFCSRGGVPIEDQDMDFLKELRMA